MKSRRITTNCETVALKLFKLEHEVYLCYIHPI